MIGNGLTRPESCFPIWPYQPLPLFSQWRHKPLVILVWSTNTYQPADLSLNLPQEAFTNYYHRGEDRGIGLAVGIEVRWCGRVAIVM